MKGIKVEMNNFYQELNQVIEYIENHLLDEIDKSELTKRVGLNWHDLNVIFLCLTGISILDYIKNRRLTLSITDILKGDSLTHISYKYLYNSPSTYNRAFKKYQGFTPKDVKKQEKNLKLFPKIVFEEQNKFHEMEYKIYKGKELNLFGVAKKINFENRREEITAFWQEMKKRYPEFLTEKRYGFLEYTNKEEVKYYCLLEKEFDQALPITLKSDFFSIKTTSFESENIINKIKQSEKEFLSALNYKHKKRIPNIEIYTKEEVELLIPIT